MPRPKSQKKNKVNLALSDSTLARLKALQARTDADSMSEVLRRALLVYEFLLDEDANGAVYIGEPDNLKRVLLII